jgi:hypothetical protein
MATKSKADRKIQVDSALDEIDAAFGMIADGAITNKQYSTIKGWVRRQREKLKELGYKGKIPRQPKAKIKKEAKKDALEA